MLPVRVCLPLFLWLAYPTDNVPRYACGSALLNNTFRTEFSRYTQQYTRQILGDLRKPTLAYDVLERSREQFLDTAVMSFEDGKKYFTGIDSGNMSISHTWSAQKSWTASTWRSNRMSKVKLKSHLLWSLLTRSVSALVINLFFQPLKDIVVAIEHQIIKFNKDHTGQKIEVRSPVKPTASFRRLIQTPLRMSSLSGVSAATRTSWHSSWPFFRSLHEWDTLSTS